MAFVHLSRPLIAAALLAAVTSACGSSDGTTTIKPEGMHYHYVANKVFIPTKPSEQKDFGLDLNGDGGADNVLGGVLSFLSGMGFNVQQTIDKAVAEGNINLLVDFQTKDATFMADGASGVQVFLGDSPQPPACNSGETYTCTTAMPPVCTGCGRQLTGTAMFQLLAGQPVNEALAGKIAGGVFNGGPGDLTLQIALGGTMPIQLNLIGARAKLSGITATSIGTPTDGGAILGGAITQEDINGKVIPAIADQLGPIIARDCCGTGNATHPSCAGLETHMPNKCGCGDDPMASSTGGTIIGLLDKEPAPNGDCMVTSQEIQDNTTIQGLLQPDVVIDGKMALSLGVKATAVGAMFTPPAQ